jgi:hypothetical protein
LTTDAARRNDARARGKERHPMAARQIPRSAITLVAVVIATTATAILGVRTCDTVLTGVTAGVNVVDNVPNDINDCRS